MPSVPERERILAELRHSSALIQAERVNAPPKDQLPRSRCWPLPSPQVLLEGESKERALPIFPPTRLAAVIFLRVASRPLFEKSVAVAPWASSKAYQKARSLYRVAEFLR